LASSAIDGAGKVATIEFFDTSAEALEAAGLSE
jgi:hypothetical protein